MNVLQEIAGAWTAVGKRSLVPEAETLRSALTSVCKYSHFIANQPKGSTFLYKDLMGTEDPLGTLRC